MEQIRSPLAARRLKAQGGSVVFHADRDWLCAIRNGEHEFFSKLVPYLAGKGFSTRLVDANGAASKVLIGQKNINIIVGGLPGYGPNLLHAMPSYVWGFWYLDEVGVYWNSSLRFSRFCADQIDADKATYFFNGVSGHMLRENISKSPQEARFSGPMRPAAAVIFCQDLEQLENRCHFLSTEDMIRTAAETGRDELVYVKLHPKQCKLMRRQIMAVCNDYPNVKISDASVHDLSQAARVVITQNSAAAFEALMQKKPVITCARSDFWHATLTARRVGDLREALLYGPEVMANFAYEKYFYWFLSRNCLEPQQDDFAARAWARIRDKAYL
ncbi:MAG: capsular polysaccharide export protein, LipB/KpsS family [Paracoccaceae bacterium]